MIHEWTTANRLAIADILDTLSGAQWNTPTLCAGWTVRHLAAHLVQPTLIGFGRFAVTAIRFRGDTDRTVDHFARQLARRPVTELTELLRSHATDRLTPARVGPMGPFADSCLHLRDMVRPLGLAADVPLEHWRALLDYLVSPHAAPALIPPHRLDGLVLSATDTIWPPAPSDDGALVQGPAEALSMAISGRPAALADLDGPGLPLLAARIQTSWHGLPVPARRFPTTPPTRPCHRLPPTAPPAFGSAPASCADGLSGQRPSAQSPNT
ncbi:maleylpyruvate isomerase family mycothiol-dependent enzyme [Actinoplanes sp. NPDC051494]|uniref:maleylpyruvate isomerase family mycothiol-dependent enzyme n=1 Tax=Actinoplanes sp. NPDC051494 TaxID=3363907 RepID=UPI003796899C